MPYTEQFSESIARRGVESPYDSVIVQAVGNPDDVALVKAIIATESQWTPGAINREGSTNPVNWSYGLMQVLLSTARDVTADPALTGDDLLVPTVNIAIGSAYLLAQRVRFPGLTDAISAYNAGHVASDGRGGYTNQAYVNDVLHYYAFYLAQDPSASGLTLDTTVPATTGGLGWLLALGLGVLLLFLGIGNKRR